MVHRATEIAGLVCIVAATALCVVSARAEDKLKELPKDVTRVPVQFSGGHETDPEDHGRPVVLIAAALGVKPEVFREAFSHVKPAPQGTKPDPKQVRANKAALMAALGKFGVEKDRLDDVSNYYRYQPGHGDLWTNKPAVANALVKNGEIIGYEIVDGGSGYNPEPKVTVPNFPNARAKVEVAFDKVVERNGAVAAIKVDNSP